MLRWYHHLPPRWMDCQNLITLNGIIYTTTRSLLKPLDYCINYRSYNFPDDGHGVRCYHEFVTWLVRIGFSKYGSLEHLFVRQISTWTYDESSSHMPWIFSSRTLMEASSMSNKDLEGCDPILSHKVASKTHDMPGLVISLDSKMSWSCSSSFGFLLRDDPKNLPFSFCGTLPRDGWTVKI